MKLHEVAVVIAGYAFRSAIKSDPAGDLLVFQAKDLVQGLPFENVETLTKISHDTPGYGGRLQKNDVLLVARGMKSGAFRSTVFNVDSGVQVVASSSVHVIRVTSKNVLPEYLSHYLNSKEGQDALSEIVTGSYIGALPKRELEKIEIPILPLQKQRILIELHKNIQEQQKITNRQNEIKRNIINATLTHFNI